ncbi:MAG: TRAP transporter large permease subunit, partial [Pseudomonadota bacterium]
FFDGLAMLVVTMPVVFPIITGLDFDPIWFGVICVIVIEMGLITPPVGINVFVVKGVAAGVNMRTIFQGVLPFWFAMAAVLVLLILFPQIALYLPDNMK